jgi:UDP-3-O-[3-hydroxymyristoyl] glucosamine N-acyltransferase
MNLPAPVKLSFVADFIKAKLKGNPDYELTGINEIHMVRNGDLTFVDHPKYYDKALNSAATVILINKDVEAPKGKHLLVSENPFRDYNMLTRHFQPFEAASKAISASTKIGKGTIIQPGAFIGNHVTIGDNCLIHSNVSVYDHTVIGNNVVIHANTVIGGDAFYFKKLPNGYNKMYSCGRVIIEDDVELGASCTIDKGVSGDTIIGKGTKLDNQVHIGHDTVIGHNVLIAAQTGIAGVAKIEDDVILWGQVGVNKDLVIGKGAVVYAQSGVPSSIEGGKVYFGSPVLEAKEKMKELVYTKRLKELFEKK